MLGKLARQHDPNVLVGFDHADDAGVYQISPDQALVQTVDFFTPVVDDAYTFGQIAATNALSDVYAMGGRPLTSLALVCFPEKADLEILERILAGGLSKMIEAGCTVIGGHSIRDEETKFGYAVTGLVHPKKILANSGAQPGDALILTKALGTGVISTAIKNSKAEAAWIDAAVQSMQHTMNDPACVFGQAAPALLAVAATRTAGAMAEARQVSKAANAAIALEEEAEANGFSNAPWYVPGLRCEGCLVYGTAEGGYANFAEAVGGRTINAITKPVNLNWNQFSSQVLDTAVQTKTPVLFSLQGIEDIDQVLAGQARTMNTTSYELRYLQQNWPRFQNIVRFYNNGAQVAPPWQ